VFLAADKGSKDEIQGSFTSFRMTAPRVRMTASKGQDDGCKRSG
jgi:hypothetical protein